MVYTTERGNSFEGPVAGVVFDEALDTDPGAGVDDVLYGESLTPKSYPPPPVAIET